MVSKTGPTVADHEVQHTINRSFQPCTEAWDGNVRPPQPGMGLGVVNRTCDIVQLGMLTP